MSRGFQPSKYDDDPLAELSSESSAHSTKLDEPACKHDLQKQVVFDKQQKHSLRLHRFHHIMQVDSRRQSVPIGHRLQVALSMFNALSSASL